MDDARFLVEAIIGISIVSPAGRGPAGIFPRTGRTLPPSGLIPSSPTQERSACHVRAYKFISASIGCPIILAIRQCSPGALIVKNDAAVPRARAFAAAAVLAVAARQYPELS